MSDTVRVRFAPSPTGYLHVGGARTALFNWLFAKSQNGTFILRVEDTDRTRYNEQALHDLMRDLKWMGMDWDEGPGKGGEYGPYTQSERLDLYKKHAHELVEADKAYPCFCNAERLTQVREEQTAAGAATGYDRHCRNLNKDEAAKRMNEGEAHVIRLKSPLAGEVSFTDYNRGRITTPNNILDDMVLLKQDGFPTYHLASVIDDHHMKITHILRGDEWIPATSKHTLLYQAFGWEPPKFVHLPVILSSTGGKLSKRKGAASVGDFEEKGLLSEALFNFLALLGWGPGDDKEKMDLEEMISLFSLDRINSTSAVFDEVKLEWMNGQYFINSKAERFLEDFKRVHSEKNTSFENYDDSQLIKIIDFTKERYKYLPDMYEITSYFFNRPEKPEGKALKQLTSTGWEERLGKVSSALNDVSDFNEISIEACFQNLMEVEGGGFGKWVKPIRIALTGLLGGPSVYGIIEILGKEESIARIEQTLTTLSSEA